MLESTIILASLIRGYEFTAARPEIPVEVQITLRPKAAVVSSLRAV